MLRVGTDCAGMEAPIQALIKLNIPFEHSFSCEKDTYCQETIAANYHPKQVYTDMTTRDVSELPAIDLYVCGFPCQSFSSAGKRRGTREKRGQIFWYCLDVIREKRPTYFILENVKGLLTIHSGHTFERIIEELEKIGIYDIHYDVLDTKDYGLPQHRERLFIVGIKKSKKSTFHFTNIPYRTLPNVSDYVDTDSEQEKEIPPYVLRSGLLDRIPKNAVFIDIGFTQNNFPHSDQYTPSLTTGGNLWCVPMQRYATIKELLRLQGFPVRFKQVVSDTQMKKQIGNSMSVNVLVAILKELLVY
jgi:DNA (cytosine-5)-methyltransferase 1